jgi:hypothetical protein
MIMSSRSTLRLRLALFLHPLLDFNHLPPILTMPKKARAAPAPATAAPPTAPPVAPVFPALADKDALECTVLLADQLLLIDVRRALSPPHRRAQQCIVGCT